MIHIEHLTKTYEGAKAHHALDDVSLTIEKGDIFGIIGASGAGKSTLVRCINLLERPTSGRILIDGQDVTNLQGKELIDLRQSIGMIFQDFSLFQQRTALRNVTFPLELRHEDRASREARAREMLALVGLTGKEHSYPSQLSGGQQQRVAIARALVNNPKIMLCDEATSALDTRTTVSILELLKSINRDMDVTMMVITHSLSVAERICNKLAVIDEGRIVEQGKTADLFANPQSPVTQELLGSDFLPKAAAVGADAAASPGASVAPATTTSFAASLSKEQVD